VKTREPKLSRGFKVKEVDIGVPRPAAVSNGIGISNVQHGLLYGEFESL
jgi:hypothetical protein